MSGRIHCILIALVASSIVSAPAGMAGDMAVDSPVKFPKEGALPSKYPPDRQAKDWTRIDGDYSVNSTPERSVAQIDKIQAEMPKGRFSIPKTDWSTLQRTRHTLIEGGKLRLLAMGDSIVFDTMHSGWVAKLSEAYPKAEIEAKVYVRGGGGCQHYKLDGRIQRNVAPRKPDLVLIGGISQKDVESIREVIHQLRSALPEVEILLFSGTFGTADPRVPEDLAKAASSGTGEYGKKLSGLAAVERCAYLDMTTPWAEYIRSSGVHPHLLPRRGPCQRLRRADSGTDHDGILERGHSLAS